MWTSFSPSPIIGLKAFRVRHAKIVLRYQLPDRALTRHDLITLAITLLYLGNLWEERVFFATASGRLGFAAKGDALEDDCCIIFGQPYLYVPKTCRWTPSEYVFVSVAFIRGLMTDDAYIQWSPKKGRYLRISDWIHLDFRNVMENNTFTFFAGVNQFLSEIIFVFWYKKDELCLLSSNRRAQTDFFSPLRTHAANRERGTRMIFYRQGII